MQVLMGINRYSYYFWSHVSILQPKDFKISQIPATAAALLNCSFEKHQYVFGLVSPFKGNYSQQLWI